MSDNGVVSNAETLVEKMAQWLLDAHQTVVGSIGPRQYGQEFIPEKQQARNAGFGFNDPTTWQGIVDSHGPEAAINHFVRTLQLKEQYPEDFQFGIDAAGANTPPPPDMQQPPQPAQQPMAPPQAQPTQQMPPQGGPNVAV